MGNLTKPKAARILRFKSRNQKDGDVSVSEVTRSIFADTWRAYVDEPTLAVIKFETKIYSGLKTSLKKTMKSKKKKLTLV